MTQKPLVTRVLAIMDFLRRELADGPRMSRDVYLRWCNLPPAQRTGRGHNDDSGAAFAEACRRLGVTSRRLGDGYVMSLPRDEAT